MARRIKEGSAAPASNVYTGILAFSCLAMLVSCAFLYLEWSRYPDQKPQVVASRR
jgi:hypothetical protein